MELSGMHFVYSGTYSRKYGLIFANVNTDRNVRLAGEIETTSIFNYGSNRRCYIGDSYDDSALQFDAEVITDNDKPLGRIEQREVEKWLFHRPGYQKLYIDVFDDCLGDSFEFVHGEMKQLYLNCRFTSPERIESDAGVVGYKFTIECDSSMAWQDAVSYIYNTSHETTEDISIIEVNVDTDVNDFVYPKVTIQIGDIGGDITIINHTDDGSRLTTFVGLTPNINLVMNGNGINYVSGDNYMKFRDRNFIRLLDGTNRVSVAGNVSNITVEFQNQRYM